MAASKNRENIGGLIMKKRSYLTAIALILSVTLALIPIQINADDHTLKLIVIDSNLGGKGKEIRNQLSNARGESVREDFLFDITSEMTDEQKKSSDAFAFNPKAMTAREKNEIQDLLNSDKIVYLYDEITLPQVNEVFGEEVFQILDNETIKNELIEKGYKGAELEKLVLKEQQINEKKYDVIGGYKRNGKVIPFLGTIQTDDSEIGMVHYIDSILDNVNHVHLEKKSILTTSKAVATNVHDSPNHNATAYSGTTKVANINMDYFLEQDLEETVDKYDHFALKDHMELTTYNGADPTGMLLRHDLPYAGCTDCDNMEEWSPKDTTNESSISVSLPWGIGWNFTTNDDIDIDASGSQTTDYAKWFVTEARTWSSYLHNPERATPGNAWISTGTYAGVDITNIGYFDYDNQITGVALEFSYRYNY
jgi:hypothetical protein